VIDFRFDGKIHAIGGKMNKNELVKAIAAKAAGNGGPGISAVKKFVDALIETVSDELKAKGKVTLVGFGTFAVAYRKERKGVNPKTGAKIPIKAKDVPIFKPGKTLKDMVK
jgi:DNA-binding protein HU-beta